MFFKRKNNTDNKIEAKNFAKNNSMQNNAMQNNDIKTNENVYAKIPKNLGSKIKLYLSIAFFTMVAFLVFLLLYKIYSFSDSVSIQEIKIVGASTKVKEELDTRLNALMGKKINSININELKDYLQSFPWIKNASVYKNLNGKLVITILERNPYFLWLNEEGDYKIIDGLNNVVKRKLNFSLDNLIVIEKGVLALDNSQEIRFLIYSDLVILKQIKKIIYDGYRWDIILKNGIIIKLPERDMKLAYLKIISLHKKQGVLNKNIEYIDARSINKLFIQPK